MMTLPVSALYQTQALRQLENHAIEQGTAAEQLMARAAEAAWNLLVAQWPKSRQLHVLVGRGNNGGDGLALASLALAAGWQVSVSCLFPLNDMSPLAQARAQACQEQGIELLAFDPERTLGADTVLVDAVLGIGLRGEVTGVAAQAITWANAQPSPTLALDVPSGLNADTGVAMPLAVNADVTITFIALKTGLVTGQAACYVGQLHHDDLGLPASSFDAVPAYANLLTIDNCLRYLPKRSPDSHKGLFGHVLVIGGDYGMGGAVCMAAEAALRVGAGLVSVATRPEHAAVVNVKRPEIMSYRIEQAADLAPVLARATVVVIGPGLGQTEWSHELYDYVMQSDKPKVIDADALNILSQRGELPAHAHAVITPHPGEAARLLNSTPQKVQEDRFRTVRQLQQQYQCTVALKGAGTLVADSEQLRVCDAGNPGMATGGMGDVLSGVIGGLCAQGLDAMQAASCGVLIHARAGDLAAEVGGERGLLATDLMNYLRQLANQHAACH